ncbi:MAG: prepilin-type N-terminal cleavage/methylation domain-containing protein [Syntrophales bacterium]
MKKLDFGKALMRTENGFTLIEIMIAIMLLVVALLGMVSVTTMVINGNALSKRMTTATTLAKDKMEDWKNMGYSGMAAGTEIDYAMAEGTVQAAATGSYYKRTSTLTANSPAANMMSIEVKVEWPQASPAHDVTLNTIVAAGF